MSLLLIGIAAWGIGFGLISSFRVVGVAIAVGIFLFFIALVGLIGAVKHHQVLLFFVSFSVLHGLRLGSSYVNNLLWWAKTLVEGRNSVLFWSNAVQIKHNSQLYPSFFILKILKYFNFFRVFKVRHCIINPSHCALNPKATLKNM